MPARNRATAPDPGRSIALLWRAVGPGRRPAPAGRSGLTVDGIVSAAVKLADEEGLDAVTMRRVAEHLSAGTMSLYTHVPARTDLIDLMTDSVLGGLYADVDEPARAPGGWRGGLTFIARRNWELYLAHPWLLDVVQPRPVLGPNTILKYETELRAIDGVGLTDVEMDSVLTLVTTHVTATARALAMIGRTERESGMDDQEWWQGVEPVLIRYLGDRFPVAGRVGEAAAQVHNAAADPRHALEFGLECILDGVEALIARR